MIMREAPNFKMHAVRRHGALVPTWSIQIETPTGRQEIIQIRIASGGLWQVWYTESQDEAAAFNWNYRFGLLQQNEDFHAVLFKVRAWYEADWLRDKTEHEAETKAEMAWLNYAEYDPEALAFEEHERKVGLIH